jgi:hypothetical protein
MTDLKLDGAGDVVLLGGDLTLTAAGLEDTTQRVRCRLDIQRGSWELDLRLGVPWLDEVLGRPRTEPEVTALIVQAIATTPGVLRVDSIRGQLNRTTRAYTLSVTALVADAQGGVTPVRLELDATDPETLSLVLYPQGGY